MLNDQPTYGPPLLREDILTARLLDWYPSHKGSLILLTNLVEEYKRFWRLILNYPHRRVVAPGPIMAVQRAHQFDARRYFDDCMTYFNKFMRRDMLAWHGRTDYVGTFDTIMVYQDLFATDPPVAWIDMSHLANINRGTVRLLHKQQ